MNKPIPGLNNSPKNASRGVYIKTGATVPPDPSNTCVSTPDVILTKCINDFSATLAIRDPPLRTNSIYSNRNMKEDNGNKYQI